MKEHMKYIIDHAEEIEKLIKVKAQVSEVKSIMLENIDKVNKLPKDDVVNYCNSFHFYTWSCVFCFKLYVISGVHTPPCGKFAPSTASFRLYT